MKKILFTIFCFTSIYEAYSQGHNTVSAYMNFIKNEGQWASPALYGVKLEQNNIWFVQNGIVFDILNKKKSDSQLISGHVIKQRFVNSQNYSIIPSKQICSFNFLKGSSQSHWRSGVMGFDELQTSNIYKGIYAKYYIRNGVFKYDILVQPQAKPEEIKFVYEGLTNPLVLRKNDNTNSPDLVIKTSAGEVVETIPECYQIINGKKTKVSISFFIQNDTVSFRIGGYDTTQTLVIDPAVTLNSYFGGSGDDFGKAIRLDTLGNVYLTGMTNSADLPTTLGAYNTNLTSTNGTFDIFVCKLNRNATSLIYATFVGGSANDEPTGMKITKDGIAVVCGFSQSLNFPKINSIHSKKLGTDGIVFALSPNGSSLRFSTYLGGDSNDEIHDIYLDSKDTIFVAGVTSSVNFPTTTNAFQTLHKGFDEGFITKISPFGSSIIQSTFVGGSLNEKVVGICGSRNGDICVAGRTSSPDFATTTNAYRTTKFTASTDADCFLVRFSRNLAIQNYSTYIGGTSQEEPSAISADSLDNIFITGWTLSGDFPYSTLLGGGNWFLAKFSLTPGAGSLAYCVKVGNITSAATSTVQTDPTGNAIVCGSDNNGLKIIRYDPNGNSVAIIPLSGNIIDVARGSDLSNFNDFYFCGTTNFPTLITSGIAAYDSVLNLNSSILNFDAFVMRYSFDKRPFAIYPSERKFDTLTCDTIAYDTIFVENQGEEDLRIGQISFLIDDGFFKVLFPNVPGFILLSPKQKIKIIVRFSTRYNADKQNYLVLYTNEGSNVNTISKESRIKYSAVRIAPAIEYFNKDFFREILFPPEIFCNSFQTKDTSLFVRNPNADSVTVISIRMAVGKNYKINTPSRIPSRLAYQRTVPLTLTRNITEIGSQFGLYKDTIIVEIKECNGELRIPVESKMDSVTFRVISKDTVKFKVLDICNGEIADTQRISIENKGKVPIWLNNAIFGDSHFKILETLPLAIAPDQTRDILAIYTHGTSNAPITTTLRLVSKPCNFNVNLAVITQGIKSPVNPPFIYCDFKKYTYCKNDDYVDTVLTFKNISDVILDIMPSNSVSNFVIVEPKQYPLRLLPGDLMKIKLRFIPSGQGKFRADFKFPFVSGTCADTLTVTGEGESITPYLQAKDIDLGILETCKPTLDSAFYVYNIFSQEILIDSIVSVKGWLREQKIPRQVKPDDSTKIDYHFSPNITGIIADTILIYSSQPCSNLLRVAIKANKFGNVIQINESQLFFPTTLDCVVEYSEKLIDIKNYSLTGEGNTVTVRSVKMFGSPEFKLYPVDILGQQIKVNGILKLVARLEADKVGQYSAEAEIVFDPCNDTIRVKMFGVIEPAIIPLGQLPIFQPVLIGNTSRVTAELVNSTNTEIRIDSLSEVIKPFKIINISAQLPTLLKKRESIKIDFEFEPETPGNAATIVKAYYSKPCFFTSDIRLSAEGAIKPQEFNLCVSGQYGVQVGSEFDIPIKSISASPILSGFDGKLYLNFDKNNLAVLNNFPPNIKYESTNNGGILSFTNLKPTNQILTNIRFLALVPKQGSIPFIRLERVALTDPNMVASICLDSAFVSIGNRCVLNGTNLSNGRNYLLKPTPNPVSSELEIKFGQLESTSTTVKIVDVSGNEVFTPLNGVFNKGGDYILKISSLSLPTGVYYILLQAGEYQASQVLHVRK